MPRTNSFASLALIVLWSFLVHVPGLLSPLRDYHAYRQCQTASMSRNYVRQGMHFLSPAVDTEGPPVRAGTEFPIYSYLVALLYKICGIHEVLGRILSAVFAAWGAVFLYRFIQPRLGEVIARWSGLAMCSIPIHIYFTRTVQPEPMALWGMLGFLYYGDQWFTSTRKTRAWLYAFVLGATAPLLKLPFLYLIGPLWLFLAVDHAGFRGVFRFKWLLLLAGILASCAAWYHYAKTASVVLLPLTREDHLANLAPILTAELWKDQFISRFPELLFTYAGLILAGLGLYNLRRAKPFRFFVAWSLASVVYLVLLGEYGHIHKYTLLPLAPIAAVWMASGVSFLFSHSAGSAFKRAMFVFLLVGVPLHAALRIQHWYRVEYDYLQPAKDKLDATGDHDSLVIVATHEKPQHLYYLDRYGYALQPKSWTPAIVDGFVSKGARFILIPKDDNQARLGEWTGFMRERNAVLLEDHPDYLLYQFSARHG